MLDITPAPNFLARPVPSCSGAKMKLQAERNADTSHHRDRNALIIRFEFDNTSVKTWRLLSARCKGSRHPVDLLRGLIVEVEGRGDAQGEIVADKHFQIQRIDYARGDHPW